WRHEPQEADLRQPRVLPQLVAWDVRRHPLRMERSPAASAWALPWEVLRDVAILWDGQFRGSWLPARPSPFPGPPALRCVLPGEYRQTNWRELPPLSEAEPQGCSCRCEAQVPARRHLRDGARLRRYLSAHAPSRRDQTLTRAPLPGARLLTRLVLA